MKKDPKRALLLILALVGVSLLSAGVGALMANSVVDRYAEALDELIDMPPQVTAVKPPVVPGTVQEAIRLVQERTEGATLGVYSGSVVGAVVRDNFSAVALPLTTDGWVAYPLSSETTGAHVLHERVFYPLQNAIADPETGYRFAKTGMTDARVGTFGASDRVEAGDIVYVVAVDRILPRTVVHADWYSGTQTTESSDTLDRRFLLDQPVEEVAGAAVVDGSGALLGVMETGTLVRPLHHLTSAFESILLDEAALRVPVGISVVDTDRVFLQDVATGLLVTTVERTSPFADSLAVDDVILRVNGRSVNELPLAELFLDVHAQDTVVLLVVRDGEEQEISVTL